MLLLLSHADNDTAESTFIVTCRCIKLNRAAAAHCVLHVEYNFVHDKESMISRVS
jgi:hypothetical protein